MNIQIRTTFTDTQERKNRKEKGANGFILKEDKNGVHHKKKKEKKEFPRSYHEIMDMDTNTHRPNLVLAQPVICKTRYHLMEPNQKTHIT